MICGRDGSGRRETAAMRISLDLSTDPGDYPFSHPVRVRFAETDAMGVAHHAAYVPWFEEARAEWLRALGRPYGSLRADGIDLAVLELVVQYRRSARFEDVVQVHTRMGEGRGATFQLDYLATVAGEVAAVGATVHGVVGPDGRARRMPADLRSLLGGL